MWLYWCETELNSTTPNLASNIQNIESSRSNTEPTRLAKKQILEQSATAMLTQTSTILQNVGDSYVLSTWSEPC